VIPEDENRGYPKGGKFSKKLFKEKKGFLIRKGLIKNISSNYKKIWFYFF